MDVHVCRDDDEVGRRAAERIAQVAHEVGPQVVLGVATGSSPLSTFEHLAQLVHEGRVDLAEASAVALDEYVGLPPGHPESYAEVVRRTVTEPLGLDPARVFVPQGGAGDLAAAAAAHEEAIRRLGGVDVQVLGIGSDGHIGFNEPGSPVDSRTRRAQLTEQTRRDNARFFPSLDDVPHECLTEGLGTIMSARHIVLVVQGESKAEALAAALQGPVTTDCPGSILQRHPSVVVFADEAAAGMLILD